MPKNKKTKSAKNDGAIVVPIKRVKTASGKDPAALLAGENLEDQGPETAEMAEEWGRDLRIRDGKVLIKFPKFVHLVVMHDFEEVMRKHEDEDIVISSELLVDLANAHEEMPEVMPWGQLIAAALLGGLITFALAQLF